MAEYVSGLMMSPSTGMGRHEIFICFSSKDEAVARAVVQFLEDRRLKCWFSSRDVGPGENFQEAIVTAIQATKVVVFLFSDSSAKSGEIKKELALAGSFGASVIPLRLSEVFPTGALRYELATRQWIDFFPDRERALEKLALAITQVLRPCSDASAGTESASFACDSFDHGAHEESQPVAQPERRKVAASILARDSAEFEAISTLLARNIGPIAKLFVEKASIDARSIDELCERLSVHIRAPADRPEFLRAARARLSSLRAR